MNQAEKSRRSKEAIILAAAENFSFTSYNKASLNQICHKNHISKGRFYHHFESKEELYHTCLRFAVDKMVDYWDVQFYDNMDLEAKCNAIFNSQHKFVIDNPSVAIFFFRTFQTPPEQLKSEIECQHERYRAAISKTLFTAFAPYPWFKKEQLPLLTEMFITASKRLYEIGLKDWAPDDPPEKQKTVINNSLARFDSFVHLFI